MERRPELLSSVMLRQNPHNVHEWHKRAKLFAANPTKQILCYTGACFGGEGVGWASWLGRRHSWGPAMLCQAGSACCCVHRSTLVGLACLPLTPPSPHPPPLQRR